MSHHQHRQVEEFFQPILKRDFITFLPGKAPLIKLNFFLFRQFARKYPVFDGRQVIIGMWTSQ
jgi:hypothetical protein